MPWGTEDHFRTMYEASMVRDEGMAKTLVTRQKELRRDPSESRRIIVSYTGGVISIQSSGTQAGCQTAGWGHPTDHRVHDVF